MPEQKSNLIRKYILLGISLSALLCTLFLTYSNIQYFRTQRSDVLNQLLFEKKINAGMEMVSDFHEYLSLFHIPISFGDTTYLGHMTREQFDIVDSEWDNLLLNVYTKWSLILPGEVLDEYSKVLYLFLQLYRQSGEILFLQKQKGENIEKINSVSKEIIKTRKELQSQIFGFYNVFRDNLGIDRFNFETTSIINRIEYEE